MNESVVEGGADARYLPTGHLLYVRSGTLLAAPFDAARLDLTGEPVGMIDDVMQAAVGGNFRVDTGAAQFAVSNTGTLAYVPGGVYPKVGGQLVWVDRRGRIEPLGSETAVIGAMPRLSPDGRHVALIACPDRTPGCRDVWTYDLERRRLARLTFGAGAFTPVWTHDARAITFTSDARGPYGMFQVPSTEARRPRPSQTSS